MTDSEPYMASADGLNSIEIAEHVGPIATGDNIEAKRVSAYVWDGANWQRMTQPGTVAQPSSATETNVASSASNVTLLVSNSSRKQATFYNDSTQVLYLKLGATASATSYTVQLVAGAYYELPAPVYTGIIDGIWASANGNARVTEM